MAPAHDRMVQARDRMVQAAGLMVQAAGLIRPEREHRAATNQAQAGKAHLLRHQADD